MQRLTPAPKPKAIRFKPKKKRDKNVQIAVVERDGMCMWCGRIDDTLVGHHIYAWGASGDDSMENIITLCGKCHGDVGNGYLDISSCNHPWLLAMITPKRFLGASARDGDTNLWDAQSHLECIMDRKGLR